MKFNPINYLQYTPPLPRLQKRKSIKNKLKEYRWEIIIPFMLLIVGIMTIAFMQLPKSVI